MSNSVITPSAIARADMQTNPVSEATLQAIATNIARELREHPEHWTQGKLVRFANGDASNSPELVNEANATCWCVEGLIIKHVGTQSWRPIVAAFRDALGITELYIWNDEQTTVAEVIDACERVACFVPQQEEAT